jgi:hypothetical protein
MKRLFPFIVISLVLFLIVLGSCTKKETTVYELTSDVFPSEGGTISPAQGTFDEGEQVTISAISSQGYYFKTWSGNISGTNNPNTFAINSDTKVIAIFVEDDEDGDGVSNDMDNCPGTPSGENVNAEGCADSQNDSDGDSVSDDIDLCPDTPVGETVDADGCSGSQKDTDNDGVTDDLDECPETQDGLSVDDNGCADNQKDSDSDGVNNDTDLCPDTPSGETVDAQGCSDSQKDSDADGVMDNLDQCQNTPPGETVDSEGCSSTQSDSDGDTITDDFDDCPNTPSGESVDDNGCSDSQKDADNDGVTDDNDQCPNTPSGEGVNSNGCSSSQNDTDGDGVLDNLDQCPGTPSGETVDTVGCSDSQKDSDVDGVNDDVDQCPDTPTGETVDSNGCSSNQNDSDGDGVNDSSDDCPNTPTGETVDVNGCADSQKDLDGDGVNDDEDQCPNTPSGESVDANGCADSQKDTDGDGVTDDIDACPGTEMGVSVNNEGCQVTYVPDDNFEQYLIDEGYDDALDDYVLTENMKTVIDINFDVFNESLPYGTIVDFTGIEDCESLKTFYATGLGAADFSFIGFSSLERITFYQGGPENINISNNPNLLVIVFECDSHPKSAIIDNNPRLGGFIGGARTLVFTNNLGISDLYTNYCNTDVGIDVRYLTFTNNPSVTGTLYVNFLVEGHISNNENLEGIRLGSDAPLLLEKIVCNNNPKLNSLGITDSYDGGSKDSINQIDISSNNFDSFDTSLYVNLTQYDITNNPGTCIQVSLAQLDNIPAGWAKDPEDVYSLTCD